MSDIIDNDESIEKPKGRKKGRKPGPKLATDRVYERPVGQKVIYTPEHAKKYLNYMAAGLTQVEVAALFGVSRQCLWKWANQHPEFREAQELGYEFSLAKNIDIMRKGTMGEIKSYNVAAHNSILNNMYRQDWNRTSGNSITEANIHITNNTLNVMSEKTTEELLHYVTELEKDLADVVKPVVLPELQHVKSSDEE